MSRFKPFIACGVATALILPGLPRWQPQAIAADGLAALLNQTDQESGGRRTPLPPAAESRASLEEVKDIFRTDYSAATTGPKKAGLAAQLLSHAKKTPKPADRWVMYSEAMRLAADAGDVSLTLEVIATTAGEFDVDKDSLTLDALAKLAPKASPNTFDDLARKTMSLATKASDSGRSDIAQRALALASTLAKKAKNKDLLADISGYQQSLKDREKVSRELAAMESKLAAGKDDPNVCLDVGKYFCFEIDDWKRGLPLLAKGADTELARLAVAETNSAKSADALLSLADAWRTWAETEKASLKTGALQHAVEIYRSILPAMEGLDRVRVEKLIDETVQSYAAQARRVALADLSPESASDIAGGFRNDGTIGGDPFVFRNEPCPKALSAHITENAKMPSLIRYRIPASAKRLVGKAAIVTHPRSAATDKDPTAPQTFEVLLDGRSVWKSPPLGKRDEAVDFDISLKGAKTVELRVSSSNYSNARTAWLNPEFVQ